MQNYHDACLERRDELDDAASSTARASTPDLESRSEYSGVRATGSLQLEKLKCKVFSGRLGDYPKWRKTWTKLMHPRMDLDTELEKLEECVPARAQVEIKNCTTLEAVWRFMDKEYGSPTKLAAQRVEDLHSFKYSAKAKSETTKTRELYDIWREVYSDLEVVNAVSDLDNAHCMNGFVKKFPVLLKREYVKFLGGKDCCLHRRR